MPNANCIQSVRSLQTLPNANPREIPQQTEKKSRGIRNTRALSLHNRDVSRLNLQKRKKTARKHLAIATTRVDNRTLSREIHEIPRWSRFVCSSSLPPVLQCYASRRYFHNNLKVRRYSARAQRAHYKDLLQRFTVTWMLISMPECSFFCSHGLIRFVHCTPRHFSSVCRSTEREREKCGLHYVVYAIYRENVIRLARPSARADIAASFYIISVSSKYISCSRGVSRRCYTWLT